VNDMKEMELRIKQIENHKSFQGTDVELSSILDDGGAFIYKDVVYAALRVYDEDDMLAVASVSTDVVEDLNHALQDTDFLKFTDTTLETYKSHPELFLYDYISYYGLYLETMSTEDFLFKYIIED
jgi:hypothetical protein